MNTPADLRYTRDHEWLRLDGSTGMIGITDYAQDQLGDVVFIELPAVGRQLKKGEAFGVVESVKTVSDLFCPIDGTVTAVNDELADQPEIVNQDPYQKGWIIKISLSADEATAELLDSKAYEAVVQGD